MRHEHFERLRRRGAALGAVATVAGFIGLWDELYSRLSKVHHPNLLPSWVPPVSRIKCRINVYPHMRRA
eukprot:6178852-Amphidinium_carterae.1